jgi:NlpC/P60 family putative phage cell wall peptidase
MSKGAVTLARKWLGTPFLAGASVQGVGCDCAGLIEGIAAQIGTPCPTRHVVQHDILAAASAFLVPTDALMAGNLVLLAREPNGPPVHAALITDANTLIHAHWSAGVVENRLGNWFTRRVTHIFAWPTTDTLKDK